MKRKVLQDHANTLCQMFVGWRMTANDVPRLMDLGAGTLAIDVLTGHTRHDGRIIKPLFIAGELQLWFADQLRQHEIPTAEIQVATIEVAFTSKSSTTRRGEYHVLPVRCHSEIRTATRTYVGDLAEDVQIHHVQVT